MKKIISLSLATTLILFASDSVELEKIDVVESTTQTTVKNVSSEDIQSADLANALSREVPNISLVRRSGIANDIILRGQKKDNINILIDGTKVYGACPNRMDPPTSHILTNNIDSVTVSEGPFDVENFGSMSGVVKIKTLDPTKDVHGDVNLNMGSWGYKKASAVISGGTDKVKVLFSASTESSEQYKDGDGNTLSQQLKNAYTAPATGDRNFQTKYSDMDAYEKKTFMGKIYINVTDNQELRLSYTANRSDDILYPSSPMDALYDDSNIFNAEYLIKNISDYSKELSFQYYQSDVDHPMSTKYRNSSIDNASAMMGEMVSALTTDIYGFKIKNSFDLNDNKILIGLDRSKRNWDGTYTMYKKDGTINTASAATGRKSINDVDTINNAIFSTVDRSFGNVDIKFGARYDSTKIETASTTDQDNDYNSLNANLFATLNIDNSTKYFAGIGKSSRVPDARELYFVSSTGASQGTATLNQTTNYELDLGVEKSYDNSKVTAKIFYSKLKDFIVNNASLATNKFENVDAKIYGFELNGYYNVTDSFYIDGGAAYQRGTRDNVTSGTDKDLAEIPPLKGNIGFNYDDETIGSARLEVVASSSWNNYDTDNGEQKLDSWSVLNFKYNKELAYGLDATVGIDNIFDKTYALSNTYQDLTLISATATTNEVMLLNEPGRYVYVNLRYKF